MKRRPTPHGTTTLGTTTDGTTTLTQANIDGFVGDAIAAGKTAMVRFIASEG